MAQLQQEVQQLRQQYGAIQQEMAAANEAERQARIALRNAKSKQARRAVWWAAARACVNRHGSHAQKCQVQAGKAGGLDRRVGGVAGAWQRRLVGWPAARQVLGGLLGGQCASTSGRLQMELFETRGLCWSFGRLWVMVMRTAPAPFVPTTLQWQTSTALTQLTQAPPPELVAATQDEDGDESLQADIVQVCIEGRVHWLNGVWPPGFAVHDLLSSL